MTLFTLPFLLTVAILVPAIIGQMDTAPNVPVPNGGMPGSNLDNVEAIATTFILNRHFICLMKVNKKVHIDLREFIVVNGILHPSKIGILLTLREWDIFSDMIRRIDRRIVQLRRKYTPIVLLYNVTANASTTTKVPTRPPTRAPTRLYTTAPGTSATKAPGTSVTKAPGTVA